MAIEREGSGITYNYYKISTLLCEMSVCVMCVLCDVCLYCEVYLLMEHIPEMHGLSVGVWSHSWHKWSLIVLYELYLCMCMYSCDYALCDVCVLVVFASVCVVYV